ncbi:MAG: hydantoinase B/oxoprolinase family protein [Pseudorhodoplanes sp.]|uniref:hydantoinase B/oxoprolinase family protein n=1 Tax=Pseudorhodoplanes sp. TaxID=1934341 RepID=UPI003D1369B7
MKTDPIALEIFNNRFNAIVGEMGRTVYRAGFTIFIKETMDFGVGLVTRGGEIFSYSRDIGVTSLVGMSMKASIDYVGTFDPGDIVITNDPYSGKGMCTHLPDFHTFKPYFHNGELICFSWAFVHSSDVGGLVPGSITPAATDIYQEGLRIPPTKLFKKGVVNEEVRALILNNCRIPEQNWGDLKALVAAHNTAHKRLDEVVARYGIDAVRNGIDDLIEYGERRYAQVIASIKDGDYVFSDYLEMPSRPEQPARIQVTVRIRGSEMELDFTGTDLQVAASYNLVTHGELHQFLVKGLLNLFTTIDKNIPLNRGIVRRIAVRIPKGTILNPEDGASCGVRHATATRVIDTIYGALARVLDDVIPAAGSGVCAILLLSVFDPQRGHYRVSALQPLQGGTGGRPMKDGIDGTDFSQAFLRNIPTESLEHEMPVLVQKYGLSSDNPPPGKYRGGLGVEFQFQSLSPTASLTARGMNRARFAPWGLKGGHAGDVMRVTVNPGMPSERQIGIIEVLKFTMRDVVRFITPTGGGYGDPLERLPDSVLEDVLEGYITASQAKRDYAVVVADDKVDVEQTALERSTRRRARNIDDDLVTFDAARLNYEAKLPPPLQEAMTSVILALPVSYREFLRGELWSKIRDEGDQNGVSPLPTRVPIALNEIAERYGMSLAER